MASTSSSTNSSTISNEEKSQSQEIVYDRCILEVCVDSTESAIAAIQGGADRLELCASLRLGGGTTPSAGFVSEVKRICSIITDRRINIVALLRPRVGDFLYTQSELTVMLADISNLATIGIDGIAVGVLERSGSIDVEKMRLIVHRALELDIEVCFHRAFDMVKDQTAELKTLMTDLPGITRILTSGGKSKAIEGIPQLSSHLTAAASLRPERELEIMPGSGVDLWSADTIVRELYGKGLRSIHLSGGLMIRDSLDGIPGHDYLSGKRHTGMLYRPEGMGMGVNVSGNLDEEWMVWRTDCLKIRAVRMAVDKAFEESKRSVLSKAGLDHSR